MSRLYKKSGFGAGFTDEMMGQMAQETAPCAAPQPEIPSYHTAGDVAKKLENALKTMEKTRRNAPLSAVCETHLYAVSDAILRAEKMIRHECARRAGPPDGYVYSGKPLQIPPDICRVTRPAHAVLTVELPGVLPGEKGEWYSVGKLQRNPSALQMHREIGRLVMDALLADIQKNGVFEKPKGHCFLVFRRHLPSRPGAMKAPCVDNNNVETGEVTNAICKAVGTTDGHQNMGFVYLSAPDEERFVEAILCEDAELTYWLPCLKK